MENTVEVFEHEVFSGVVVFIKEGEPWFKGADIAASLGYANLSRDIQRHVDEEDKWLISNKDTDSVLLNIPSRGLLMINESGLYSLIMKSKLPQAKVFKRWVTSEVLPSIRKHGGYMAGQETMSPEELLAKAVLVAQSQIDALKGVVKEKEELISDKNFPISLTKMFSGNNKVTQAANLYMEDKGWIEKTFEKGIKKGWRLTVDGESLGLACQFSKHSVYWTPSILKLLPSQSKLLEFAERMDLVNWKKV